MKYTKVKDVNYYHRKLEARGYKLTKHKTEFQDIFSKTDVKKWLENLKAPEGTEARLIKYRDLDGYNWDIYELWTRPKMTKDELYIEIENLNGDLKILVGAYVKLREETQGNHLDYNELRELTEQVYNDIKEGLF